MIPIELVLAIPMASVVIAILIGIRIDRNIRNEYAPKPGEKLIDTVRRFNRRS